MQPVIFTDSELLERHVNEIEFKPIRQWRIPLSHCRRQRLQQAGDTTHVLPARS